MKTSLDLHEGQNDDGKGIRVIEGLPENCVSPSERHMIPSRNIPDHALGRYRIKLYRQKVH
jgi:hypothetical protein